MGFNMDEVRELASDMAMSLTPVKQGVQAAVKRGAVNVKNDAKRDIVSQVGRNHAKHYAGAITFDLMNGGMAAEIGPETGHKQAFLGKILEFGTATSPAHPHLVPAVEREQEKLVAGILVAVEKALK